MADYAIQYSFRQAEVLINVPIVEDDPDLIGSEIETKLGVVEAHAALSASVQAALSGAAVAAGILGAKPAGAAPTPAYGTPQGQGGGGGGASYCEHGQRVWKEGTSKSSGKPYKGYFCGSNVQGCAPVFSR